MVQRAADQPVRSQFTPQGGELAAPAILQKSLRDAECAAKTGYDSPYGCDFDLRRCVTHQINFTVSDLPPYRHPAAIDRDARALPFERLQVLLFKEAFEAAFRVVAMLSVLPERFPFRRFVYHPLKVGLYFLH